MGKANIIINNQNQSGFEAFQKSITTRKLSCRNLVRRLKEFIDKITDPVYRHQDSTGWARDYGTLLFLLLTQDINREYVKVNLGKQRWELIQKIIKNVKEQVEGSIGK